ncbi:hypothetical protein T492DRAFT_841614 [Pavlovales sp. CCMP2436]|nr:hypothetical protein T492DRAFT_841614 [Pavlovales sp. CCMP2436]
MLNSVGEEATLELSVEEWTERCLEPALEARVAELIAGACDRKLGADFDHEALAALPAEAEATRLLTQLRLSRKVLLAKVAQRMRAYAAAQHAVVGLIDGPERGARLWASTSAPPLICDGSERGAQLWVWPAVRESASPPDSCQCHISGHYFGVIKAQLIMRAWFDWV